MLLCNSKQDMTIPTIGKYNIIVPGILYVSMAVHTLHVLSQTVKIKTATNMIRLAFLYFCKMSSPQRFQHIWKLVGTMLQATVSFVLCFTYLTLMKIAFHFDSV